MRPIWAVIKAIQTRVPVDFDKRADFLNTVSDISESAAYTSPEAMYSRWEQLFIACNEFLGDPNGSPWKTQIAQIMEAKLDYAQFLGASE